MPPTPLPDSRPRPQAAKTVPAKAAAKPLVIEPPQPVKRPTGVPANYHLLWVEPKLAEDLHRYPEYGPKGLVIPHHFAPVHARMMASNGAKPGTTELPTASQANVPAVSEQANASELPQL